MSEPKPISTDGITELAENHVKLLDIMTWFASQGVHIYGSGRDFWTVEYSEGYQSEPFKHFIDAFVFAVSKVNTED